MQDEIVVACFDCPDTLNYGSMMMAESFIYHLSKTFPQVSFRYLVMSPDEMEETNRERFLGALGEFLQVQVVPRSRVLNKKNKISKVFSLITGKKLKQLVKEEKIDIVVVLGGDDFTYDDKHIIKELIEFKHFLKQGIPIVFLGQSMGPFKKGFQCLYSRFLAQRNIYIYTRGPISFDYLTNKLGLKNVAMSADLAFLPLCREGADYFTIVPAEYANNYLTVIPSGLLYKYSLLPRMKEYICFLADACAMIAEKLNIAHIVLLPHVLSPPESDDRPVAENLEDVLGARGLRVTRVYGTLLPYQARQIIGQGRLVFTGRMHGAVSALEQGVPPLALAYSGKFHDVIGAGFGLPELVVDVRNKPWERVLIEAGRSIDFVRDNFSGLRTKIISRAEEMRKRALSSIVDVGRILGLEAAEIS